MILLFSLPFSTRDGLYGHMLICSILSPSPLLSSQTATATAAASQVGSASCLPVKCLDIPHVSVTYGSPRHRATTLLSCRAIRLPSVANAPTVFGFFLCHHQGVCRLPPPVLLLPSQRPLPFPTLPLSFRTPPLHLLLHTSGGIGALRRRALAEPCR